MEKWHLSPQAVTASLGKLCAELGYCLWEREKIIIRNPPQTVDAFTDAVLAAEGIHYPTNRMRRELRDRIEAFFEQEITAFFEQQELGESSQIESPESSDLPP